MNIEIEDSWKEILQEEFHEIYFTNLLSFIEDEYNNYPILPEKKDLFNAFYRCPFDNVKVVILGQDPYPAPERACGLAFSIPPTTSIPGSLRNIYKELKEDVKKPIPDSGCLNRWTDQGVFLLNSILTVRSGQPRSHRKKGWETFTNTVIKKLSEQKEYLVFMLWGNYAKSKKLLIDDRKHLVLTAAHPSPCSATRGFFGCKHFSQANKYLRNHHLSEIDW